MSNRWNGRALRWVASAATVVLWLSYLPEATMAQRGSKPGQATVPARGSAPQAPTAQQKQSFSAAQLNALSVRVPPQTTEAKLKAAFAALEDSEQKLKVAVTAMLAYQDREGVCAAKTWTAEEMEKGCLPDDSLKGCKEKLVAACAAARGPKKDRLWSNVQSAAADVNKKVQAVNAIYAADANPNLGIGYPGIQIY